MIEFYPFKWIISFWIDKNKKYIICPNCDGLGWKTIKSNDTDTGFKSIEILILILLTFLLISLLIFLK
ncbi:MAG: hypothetical protein ACOC56_03845 [Atribacterota bacterium]